ncbi:unnamed protein product [Mytilus coruscus]|uniref:Uncharacterized protein n=1 Tax=Mytilus coruscus TaxID=42192 RepID=A0A6J8EAF7_MYTCO|nr:unnamed protein product [Mytilus coruscus]
MQTQCILLCFLAPVICHGTETVLDLFPEYKIVQRRIDALEKENKALKAEIDQKEEGMLGSTFVRWGRSTCNGTTSSLVYNGYMAGPCIKSMATGSNYLCLSSNPEKKSFPADWNSNPGHLYGIGWELSGKDRSKSSSHVDDKDVPCAVCLTKRRTTLMIPGRTSCYSGWTQEYTWFLVSTGANRYFATTEYVCADDEPLFYGSKNYNQGILSLVEVKCGSIPCNKYEDRTKLSCVVCSK